MKPKEPKMQRDELVEEIDSLLDDANELGYTVDIGVPLDLLRSLRTELTRLRAQVAEGWVVVPREPTREMLWELMDEWESTGGRSMRANYTAMLSAAPTPSQAGEVDRG